MSPDASADAAVVFPSDRTEDSSGDDLLVDVGVLGTVVRIRTVDTDSTAWVRRAWHLALAPRRDIEVPEDRTITMTDVQVLGSAVPSERRSRAMVALTQRVTYAALRAQAGTRRLLPRGRHLRPENRCGLRLRRPGWNRQDDADADPRAAGWVTSPTRRSRSERTGRSCPISNPSPSGAGGRHPEGRGRSRRARTARPDGSPWIAGLVILRRQDGARLERRAVATLDAIAALSPETSALAALDRPLRRLADVLERAGGLEIVTYSEADQLRSLVDEVLRRTR